MAIAFGRAGHNQSAAPASPLVVTVTINAGETAELKFESAGASLATITTMPAGWTKRGTTINQGNHRVEHWSTDAGAALGVASVSIAFSGAPDSVAAVVEAWTGVLGIGPCTVAAGNSTTPSISATTQDANNVMSSALTYDDASVADPGGGSGTQRDLASAISATDSYIFGKDNTAASPGSVTNSKGAFGAAGNWVATALELRTVAGGSGSPAPVTNPLPRDRFRKTKPSFNTAIPAAVSTAFRRTLHPFGAGKGKRTRNN